VTTNPDTRAAFIAGLRELASYLEEHPAVPVAPTGLRVTICAIADTHEAERAQVDAFAAVAGAKITRDGSDGYYTASRMFGPIEYESTAISAQRTAEYSAEQSYRGCVVPEGHAA